jgi:hypothetical protein
MTKSFGEDLKHRLIKNGLNDLGVFEGCSKAEIETLMKVQGVQRLPRVFKEYLAVMGKQGIFSSLDGEDSVYSEILELKEDFQESFNNRLEEPDSPDFTLPQDALVFWAYLDECSYFLTNNEEDDPPVYHISIGDDNATLFRESISAYFNRIYEIRLLKRTLIKQERVRASKEGRNPRHPSILWHEYLEAQKRKHDEGDDDSEIE